MIDSCFLLCSNTTFTPNKTLQDITERVTKEEMFNRPKMEELKELHDDACHDPWYVEEGNKMIQWIENKVAEWAQDEKIIWKATVQHHPLFAKHYTDYEHLVTTYLPILVEHKFDLYLNGHEHALEHVFYPIRDDSFLDDDISYASFYITSKFNLIERNFKKFQKSIVKHFLHDDSND